jgi:hypothetical protein
MLTPFNRLIFFIVSSLDAFFAHKKIRGKKYGTYAIWYHPTLIVTLHKNVTNLCTSGNFFIPICYNI